MLPPPQTPPTTPTTATALPVCPIINHHHQLPSHWINEIFSSLFSFLFRFFFGFFLSFFLVFFFLFLFCSTNYLNFAFVRFCCVIWSMLSRNHKARLKIDKLADRERRQRGVQWGSQSVRQLDRLQLLCNLRCVCFVSVSLFCCHFLWHLLLVSVASRRCLVFYVGWGRIFWRQHRIVAGSRHITIALTVRFVSHTQCVLAREAEGGYMARTCLMAQSNLSANKKSQKLS